MRKVYALLLVLSCCSANCLVAQNVTVNPGSGSYATLKAAFDAINAGTHTGTVTIDIVGNTSEPVGGAILNASGSGSASYTSITISPGGGAARTITAAVTAGLPLIDFNGADNVTIDGLNTGGNSLTISNTTASATSGTSTIRFIGGATGNTITNCSVLGSFSAAVGTNGGNIFFSTDANTANGNDDNTISNNNIGPAGASLPTKGIYGNGSTTTTAIGNSGIIINNNNIYDYFGAAVTSAGVYTAGGCNTWTITNNRFYQTATRTWTTGAQHSPIWIINGTATSGAQGFTITGNTIGYSSNTQTGTYTLTGSTGKFIGIYFTGITGGTSSAISNNIIASVSLTGVTSSGTTTTSPLSGITISTGVVTSNNNTIGSQSGNGSLTFSTNSTTATDIYGIFNNGSDNWTANNNNIGGISITNAAASGTQVFYGIRINTLTTVSFTGTSNIVGGTVANSIQLNATGASSQVIGIHSSTASSTLTSNTVRNLTSNIGTGTTTSASVIGINLTTTSSNHTVNQNTVHSLSNTSSSTATTVTGIQFTSSTGSNLISQNVIHSLSVASATGVINGIQISGGTATYQNNMVRLGIDASGNSISQSAAITGIFDNSTTTVNNTYYNTVYIGGTGVSGAVNTYAFRSIGTTNTRVIQNNSFHNARSNGAGTGKHYGIQIGGVGANPTGLTSNYNNLRGDGTGGVLGFYDGADRINVAAWNAATGQGANSVEETPPYINATGDASSVSLKMNTAIPTLLESGAQNIAGITTDFENDIRQGNAGYVGSGTAPDIGADEFNGMPPTCSGLPAASNAQVNVSLPTCNGASFTLSLSQSYVAVDYQWQSSSDNANWTNISNATFSTLVTSAPASTYFRALISCGANVRESGSVFVSVSPALSGTYFINNSVATGGNNFQSFTDAINTLNCNGNSGNVIFEVSAGQTFVETGDLNLTFSGAASRTVTFRKFGAGANPVIQKAGTSGTTDYIVKLTGVDYYTFNGVDLQQTGTSATDYVEFGFMLQGASAVDGAQNNTFKNGVITMNKASTASRGVYLTNTANGVAGTNSNNSFLNMTIQNAYYGYHFLGVTAAYDDNNLIGTEAGGVSTIDNIGGSTVLANGILGANQTNLKIRNTEIKNITGTGSGTTNGISLTGTSTSVEVSGCDVHDVSCSSTGIVTGISMASGISLSIFNSQVHAVRSQSATTATVRGIDVSGTNLVSNIYNNRVYDISSTGLTTTTVGGIEITTGSAHNLYNNMVSDLRAPGSTNNAGGTKALVLSGTTSGQVIRIYHNTIVLSDVSTAGAYTSACIYSSSATPTIDLRNNILINKSNVTTGTRAVAFWKTATTINQDAATNNNLYYAGTPSAKNLLYYDGTNSAQTLAQLRSITDMGAREQFSVTEDVVFVANPNGILRPNTAAPTLVESGAKLISGYTTDFENDFRGPYPLAGQVNGGGLRPDIGADEGDFTYVVPPLPDCPVLTSPSNMASGLCHFAGVTLKWQAASTGGFVTNGYDVYFGTSSNPPLVSNTSSLSYSPVGILPNTTYYWKIVAKGDAGDAQSCTVYSFTTVDASITSTTPGTRCGTGTVTLGATGNGTINWYAAATGGLPLASGSSFVTPSISSTTNYYVAAASGLTPYTIGPSNPTSVGTISNTSLTNHFLIFDVVGGAVTINSVDIFPTASVGSNYNIVIQNSANTEIFSTGTFTNTVTGGALQTKTLGAVIPPGTGYRMGLSTNAGLNRNTTGAVYPYSVPGIMNITGNTFDVEYYYFFYNMNISAACETPRTLVVATVNPNGTWNGTVNTDWNNAANWCGGIPTASDNVVIPDVTNKPVLSTGVTVNNLTINAGSSVSLNGQALSISGSLAGTGVLIGSSTSELNIGGAGAFGTINMDQTTDGTTNALANFTFNRSSGTATLGNKLVVINAYTPSAGVLTTGGNLVLRSTAAQTARVAQGALAGGYLNGDVLVERYVPANTRRAWRLLSAPISSTGAPTIFNSWQEGGVASAMGTHITQNGGAGTNGFDASTIALNGSSIRAWDGANLITPSATTLPITNYGGAYFLFVRGNRNINLNNASSSSNTTLRMMGTVNQGPVTAGVAGASFSLIPNPYPSPVDYEAIIAANGGLSGTYYVWDATLGSVGAYRTIVRTGASTYSSTPTTGSDNTMRYIRSGQAFFIPDNMQVNFTEAMKTDMLPAVNVYRPGTGTEEMTIDLKVVDGSGNATLYDGVRAKYNNSFSTSVDNNDAPKLNNFNENLSIVRDNKTLAIETRPLIDASDTIFLKLWNTGVKNYQFDINPANFSTTAGLEAKLVDNYLQAQTPVSLSNNTTYNFSITSDANTAAPDRFMIVFRSAAPLPVNFTNVKAYQKNSGIQVEWNVGTEQDVVKYEVEKSTNGTTFEKANTTTANNSKAYAWFDANPVQGGNFYRIKVINKDNSYQYSQVVNVKIDNTAGDVVVYPNPVKGNVINVQLTNMEKGTYSVQLINSLGQQVYSGRIIHNGGSSSQSLQLANALSKGVYQLVLTNGDNKMTQQVIAE